MNEEALATGSVYPVEEWLSPGAAVNYRDYWEDEDEERRKPFWVLDGDFAKMERYLVETGRVRQLEQAVAAARSKFGVAVGGSGCDLGAGVAWSVPHLRRLGEIERVWCVEYSRQRLLRLAPAILSHYGVPPEKVVLAWGDFNRVRLPDDSLDFVLMCASFHHSDDPRGLLSETRRLLKPGGVVMIIGEHISSVSARECARHMGASAFARAVPQAAQRRLLGRTVRRRRFWSSRDEIFSTDAELGDHHYPISQYHQFFTDRRFDSIELIDAPTREHSFVLVPR